MLLEAGQEASPSGFERVDNTSVDDCGDCFLEQKLVLSSKLMVECL